MTTFIPESWELPSYLAGDLYDMGDYRRRTKDAPPLGNARIIPFQRPKPKPSVDHPSAWAEAVRKLREIEPYDPEKHGGEPPELYRQDHLDALESAGFEHVDKGTWHRTYTDGEGNALGAHQITYAPGYRDQDTNRLTPWHITTDPEAAGTFMPTLRGALDLADAHQKAVKSLPVHHASAFPHWTKVGATPGQSAADDWLARNPEESFADPREEAERWMRENAHLYEEWHPSGDDYTYSDFGDAAGQTFHGDESQSHVLPGSHYRPEGFSDDAWERFHSEREQRVQPTWTAQDQEDHEQMRERQYRELHRVNGYDDEDDEEPTEDDRMSDTLAQHGFNWEPKDPTAGTPENPISPETPGKWVKHQLDMDGNHVATHTLTNDEGHQPGQWKLETELGEHGSPVTFGTSIHGEGESGLEWALHKYKSNAAEAELPRYGYEPEYGPANIRRWVRTDPGPEIPGRRHEDYEHEIVFPESGFGGTTTNHTHMAHPRFSPNGSKYTHSYDLADVVREQHQMGQGSHPGGTQDYRLTREELEADPTVARLGRPESTSTYWGDGRITRMTWRLPKPEGSPHHVNAEANYNWDKGGYDFKYTHDGSWLAATHNYVPEGAPIHIPGR